MVGLYIGWTIALAIGGAVVCAIMAPVIAFNSALAKPLEMRHIPDRYKYNNKK